MIAYKASVVSVFLLIPAHAFAQAPAAHWTTFNKQASACACHLFARDALRKENLEILEDAGSVLLAGNDQVTAEVVCMPGGGQAHVSAFSADSGIAERIRNNVRGTIIGSALFDTCP
jgi:hypothetical protein